MARTGPRLPLALTMGDPAGIGPEIAARAWSKRRHSQLPCFYWIGDPRALRIVSNIPLQVIDHPGAAVDIFDQALPVMELHLKIPPKPGEPDQSHGKSVMKALRLAGEDVLQGEAGAVVTAPVAKHLLYEAGFNHPGQTEFMAELCHVSIENAVMMLAIEGLRVVPATIHVPLREVAASLTQNLLIRKISITAQALRSDFGIVQPRIAVCGLNPHAGEAGAIGREEIDIIAPAVKTMQAQGLNISGPFAADSLFHETARAGYDAVIAMYHDQALIPIKTLDFHGGVNVTLGLPIIRTSPDHGTAFDIAGQDKADPASLIAAIKLAAQLAAQRARHGRG